MGINLKTILIVALIGIINVVFSQEQKELTFDQIKTRTLNYIKDGLKDLTNQQQCLDIAVPDHDSAGQCNQALELVNQKIKDQEAIKKCVELVKVDDRELRLKCLSEHGIKPRKHLVTPPPMSAEEKLAAPEHGRNVLSDYIELRGCLLAAQHNQPDPLCAEVKRNIAKRLEIRSRAKACMEKAGDPKSLQNCKDAARESMDRERGTWKLGREKREQKRKQKNANK